MIEKIELSGQPLTKAINPDRLGSLGVFKDPDRMEAFLRMPISSLEVLLLEQHTPANRKI